MFAGAPLTMGHREECEQIHCSARPYLSHGVHIKLYLPMTVFSLLEEVFYLNSGRQLGGSSKVLPEGFFSFLKITSLK